MFATDRFPGICRGFPPLVLGSWESPTAMPWSFSHMGCSAQVVPDHVCDVRLHLKTSSDFCTATRDPLLP